LLIGNILGIFSPETSEKEKFESLKGKDRSVGNITFTFYNCKLGAMAFTITTLTRTSQHNVTQYNSRQHIYTLITTTFSLTTLTLTALSIITEHNDTRHNSSMLKYTQNNDIQLKDTDPYNIQYDSKE
jgi:hypothetical protein